MNKKTNIPAMMKTSNPGKGELFLIVEVDEVIVVDIVVEVVCETGSTVIKTELVTSTLS